MRKISLLCAATIGSVIGATATAAQTPAVASRTKTAQQPTALLSAPMGSRSVSGTATLTGTTIRIVWSGDEPRAQRSVSVRRGSCNRDEGPLSQRSAAPVLVDPSGSASGSLTLDTPLSTDGSAYVAIHRSPVDSSTPLACGSIRDASALRADTTRVNSSVNVAAVDHSKMDHSTMNHSTTMTTTTGSSAATSDSMSNPGQMAGDSATAAMMAIHMRMMADPVIRERVRTDPVLVRMLEQMPSMDSMPGMPAAPSSVKAGTRVDAKKVKPKAAAKTPIRTPPKPATKAVPKPAPAMPGMDHSKMPGMGKPPQTRKPPV